MPATKVAAVLLITGDQAFAADGDRTQTPLFWVAYGAAYADPVAVFTAICSPPRGTVSTTELLLASMIQVVPDGLALVDAKTVPEPGSTATAKAGMLMYGPTTPDVSLMTARPSAGVAA